MFVSVTCSPLRLLQPLLLVAALLLPAAFSPAPAHAFDASVHAGELDTLFGRLKRERDPQAAEVIADEIRLLWRESGSATIDLLMNRAIEAMTARNSAAAYDFLDQAIALDPDFPESWNLRATYRYADGDWRKSMADINQVLKREPRHFGALAGMAAILTDSGNEASALKAWEQFLTLYPANREAQQQVDSLSEKLAGSRS